MINKLLLTLCFILSVFSTQAEVFNGNKFIIEITSHCEEGNISCNNVTYKGINKQTNKTIILKGNTLNSDRPGTCNFQGYEFINGQYHYYLYETSHIPDKGELNVYLKDKLIAKDYGVWSY